MTKKEIRQYIKSMKMQLSLTEIQQKSHLISQNFMRQSFYLEAEAIYPYVAYNQEIITNEIIEDAWKRGKKVAVPKVIGEGMEFFYITDLSQLEDGYCHIPEPVTTELAADKKAIILMPGLAFDPNFNRIGYGGGYYDRYLDAHKDCNFLKIALAYDFQLLEKLETEEHDYKIDALVMENSCLLSARIK